MSRRLPGFTEGAKASVTLRQLLSHSAGLPAWAPYSREVRGKDAVVARALAAELEYEPGTRSQYGDLAMILVGEIVERVSGEPLDAFVEERVLRPLAMKAPAPARCRRSSRNEEPA